MNAGQIASLSQFPDHQERRLIEVPHCHSPCFNRAMTSTWSFSVGGGLTACRETNLVAALTPRASPAGTKTTVPGPAASCWSPAMSWPSRSEEHTSELQSPCNL